MANRLVTFKDLRPLGVFYTRDHLRYKEARGEFPRHVTLSTRRIAWVAAEVDEWLARKVAERDQNTA
jgi:hypothetical protein